MVSGRTAPHTRQHVRTFLAEVMGLAPRTEALLGQAMLTLH